MTTTDGQGPEEAASLCRRPQFAVLVEGGDRKGLLHDMTAAVRPPWEGGFDLICCRNVLIYLTPPAQRRVLELLLASLAPAGHLCLGRAELPGPSLLPRVECVDRAARIFRLLNARTLVPAPRGNA